MTVAASLLIYGSVVALLGHYGLLRLTRSGVAPRIAVFAWQVAALSVVASWVLGALALDGPVPLHDLSHFLASRVSTVDRLTDAPGVGWVQAVGVLVAAAVVGRAAWYVLFGALLSCRRRARHVRGLQMVARPLPGADAVVVEHDAAMAYCLPGRARKIVVTRGALDTLTREQLAAVLAHERAHLAGRHHLALAPLRALTRAFPGVPLFSTAAQEAGRLLELCADDAAARRSGPAAVAGALRSLASTPPPAGMLAAAADPIEERIVRLQWQWGLGRSRMNGVLGVAVLLLVTGPVLAASGPLVLAAMSRSGYCPVPLDA